MNNEIVKPHSVTWGLFFATSTSAFASDNSANQSLNDLTNYLLNLGAYLGYNLQGPPPVPIRAVINNP